MEEVMMRRSLFSAHVAGTVRSRRAVVIAILVALLALGTVASARVPAIMHAWPVPIDRDRRAVPCWRFAVPEDGPQFACHVDLEVRLV
jgi:hypothetical protein